MMSGFNPGLGLLTTDNFHAGSFLVGMAVGRIWNEYHGACNLNRRKANLSLGDYLFRLSQAWKNARTDEDAVRIASETRFKYVDLKKAKVQMAVVQIEREYQEILPRIQRIMQRHNLTPGQKKLSLADLFPKSNHSEIAHWVDEGCSPATIATNVLATKHSCRSTTLKRQLSQVKKLSLAERTRREWLQYFNNDSDVQWFRNIQALTDFVRTSFLSLIPKLRTVSGAVPKSPSNISEIPTAILTKT